MDTIKGFFFGLIVSGVLWYFTDWYRFALFPVGG